MHLIHYSPQTVFINLLLLLVSPCVVKYLYSEPQSHAAGLLGVSAGRKGLLSRKRLVGAVIEFTGILSPGDSVK